MQHTQEQPHRLARSTMTLPCICDRIDDPRCDDDDDDDD